MISKPIAGIILACTFLFLIACGLFGLQFESEPDLSDYQLETL